MPIDLVSSEAQPVPQFGMKSTPNLKRTPKGGSEGSPKWIRKDERREAERTLKGGIEGRWRTPQGERAAACARIVPH
jgi:hypothetical protein